MAETDWEAVVNNICSGLAGKVNVKRSVVGSIERQLGRDCFESNDSAVESQKIRLAVLYAELRALEECLRLAEEHRNGSHGFPM